MTVKLKDSLEDKKTHVNKSKTNTVELLFFIALNILVIPFSAYQTYVGYEKDVAGHSILAIIIAAISAVLFAAMNFGIRQDRLDGKKHWLKVFFYIIPFGLSFFGNFNAFYSNQMKENLLREEISNYKFILNQTYDLAIQKINDSIDLKGFEKDYSQRWQDLETEYYDAKPPSWGPKAQEKWKTVVSYLQNEGGAIKVSDQGKIKANYYYNAKTFSKNTYKNLKESKEEIIKDPIDYINSKYDPTIKKIDSLIGLSKPEFSSSMLDKMVEVENQIRTKTESFLDNENIFDYPPLKPSDQNEIGTIKHTINSAFVKFENPSATVFSFFLSIIIDLAALIYILVFIPYNKSSNKKGRLNSGPQRL
jgi:hypothetical protein